MRRPSSKSASRKKPYKWIGHIEVFFNDDEREHVINYCKEREFDFEDSVSRVAQTRTAIKFSYEVGSDCYRATLQPKDEKSAYYGYTLGFSHVDLSRLLQITTFIVYELMENGGISIPEDRKVNEW